MKKYVNVYVVLPCYNEALNIEKVIDDFMVTYIGHSKVRMKYVLINDGSSDNTLEIISKLAKTYEVVTAIDHGVNKGLGAAVKTGIDYVVNTASSDDLMMVLDSDHTHKARFSMAMIEKVLSGEHEVVIASRFYEDSKVYGVPFNRVLLSLGARLYYTLMFGIKNVKDYTCGYRVYSLKSLMKLKMEYGRHIVEETGFSCMCELLLKLDNLGVNIGESTFELYYGDKGGDSSMQIFKTIKNSLIMPLKLRRYKKSFLYKRDVAFEEQ